MRSQEYDEACERIYNRFNKITPTGRLSKVKSNHLIAFMCHAVYCGLEKSKDDYNYKKQINDLLECGVTEEFMIEEYEKNRFREKNKKYEFIELRFDNQIPEWYEAPQSKFNNDDSIK